MLRIFSRPTHMKTLQVHKPFSYPMREDEDSAAYYTMPREALIFRLLLLKQNVVLPGEKEALGNSR